MKVNFNRFYAIIIPHCSTEWNSDYKIARLLLTQLQWYIFFFFIRKKFSQIPPFFLLFHRSIYSFHFFHLSPLFSIRTFYSWLLDKLGYYDGVHVKHHLTLFFSFCRILCRSNAARYPYVDSVLFLLSSFLLLILFAIKNELQKWFSPSLF